MEQQDKIQAGYYWVRKNNNWIVSKYDPEFRAYKWEIYGNRVPDYYFDEIDPTPITRTSLAEDNSLLHPKIVTFAYMMQHELEANRHKGDWETWNDVDAQIYDMQYHLDKLKSQLKAEIQNPNKEREFVADIANIGMMFLNSCDWFKVATIESIKEEIQTLKQRKP